MAIAMNAVEELLATGAPEITPASLDKAVRMLPRLRAKFASLDPEQPKLAIRIEFLGQVLEDFASGLCRDLTFHAVADIAFALQYFYQDNDLIPDDLPDDGFKDDLAVSELVLERHGKVLEEYAVARGFEWKELVSN
ncbi:MAG TPA: hypothetical protein VIT91_12060 [Chthoniobacterales bacterium]